MEINELVNLIVNNSFPVAVAAYLLIRLEKQINTLSGSINKLNTIISTKLGVVIDANGSIDDSHKVPLILFIVLVLLDWIFDIYNS